MLDAKCGYADLISASTNQQAWALLGGGWSWTFMSQLPAVSLLGTTPSVPNYKSFQKIWRVKLSQSLIKIIERNIKIYNIKYVYYENITNKKSNDI